MNSNTVLAKVGRKKSHREALKMNLISDLIIYEYLTTTRAKSKLVLRNFDRLMGVATGTKVLQEKERVLSKELHNPNVVNKLLEVFSKRFAKEHSGLVKVYKVGNRKGDNAEMVKLMVKGYVYKEIGKKVGSKPTKKTEAKETKPEVKQQAVTPQKDLSYRDQVKGGANAAKVKTRSGI